MPLQSCLQVIIDGYNFLMTTGMMDTQVSDVELRQGRTRLLKFLATAFPAQSDRRKITVVFDSQTLLKLPKSFEYQDIQVVFSKGYDTADELIIEMIQRNHVPKRLLIVSSDHEIQKSARRRKAKFIDSDRWLDHIENREKRTAAEDPADGKSDRARLLASPADQQFWIEQFSADLESEDLTSELPQLQDGNDDDLSQPDEKRPIPHAEKIERQRGQSKGPDQSKSKQTEDRSRSDSEFPGEIFPPGYAEDLLEELSDPEKSADEMMRELLDEDRDDHGTSHKLDEEIEEKLKDEDELG